MKKTDLLTYDGQTQTLEDWALDYGIPHRLINARLYAGCSIETAITKPMLVRQGQRKAIPRVSRQPTCTRPAKSIEFNGECLTVQQWADHLGITKAALHMRIRLGWPLERALTTGDRTGTGKQITAALVEHNGQHRTLQQWAKLYDIQYLTLWSRLRKGMPIGDALTKPVRAWHGGEWSKRDQTPRNRRSRSTRDPLNITFPSDPKHADNQRS